ncbi:SusC/RagA family TonB-linked outer membrane protein [Pedobacter punctiformis]|uniref:SusC/RagA family TonB-linked outer membrane protein n=1 Tax=Pedobacter punctiformis TaxID=3004097 RepID=A0ABT4LC07_9SPHI|nr:SusC/RagA family TonB-linked outer membrane protein [Pedobacter sp. HCMS5-2]MCZ4245451.1 SusC/RagA family TonB-linked outer membrane protein [Pedobacter sp. HCMS5-2]
MKLAQKLLFITFLLISVNSYSQTKVTLDFKSADFENVIEAIQNQTIYHFVFSQSKIPQKKVTIRVNDLEVIQVLNRILKNTDYEYALLPNALIVIKPVAANTNQPDSVKMLNEVVVTALGIEKDNRKIGYAVTSIKGSSISRARESNMIMALQGRVAGLNISGVSGGPSSSARILLRGVASMSAASPLFVVNGVPIDNSLRGSANEYGGADYGDGISNINPDDIETITILKGSAASALYGARAANGVILINLKSGKDNAGPTIEYNTNLSLESPVNHTDFQYIYGQGSQNKRPVNVYNAASTGILSWGEKMDGALSPQIDGSSKPYLPAKNNIANFYRTAPAFTNTLSLVGGTHQNIYRVSASNLDYNSILKNGHLNRKTFNIYGSFDLTKKLTLSFNANFIYENNKNKSYLSDGPLNANYGIAALATSLDQALLAPGYDEVTGNETRWNADEYKTNPYFLMNKQTDFAKRNRYISSASVKYKFNNWASVQGRFGYDISNDHILSVLPTGTAFSVSRQGGLNAFDKLKTSELNTDFLLSIKRDLTKDLNLDISLGANYTERNGNTRKIKGSQFVIPYLYTPENLITRTNTNTTSKIVTESAYYTADLAFKRFLNLSLTGRYDIYSTLPSNNRGIFVPGISGSFVFSDLLSIKNLSFGKLRLDYAKTSGEPIVPYTTQIYYSSDNQVNGVPVGSFSKDLPNYNLKPFTLSEFEAGLNLKFFGSRLDIDFTYFYRVTHNEIINAKQSITTGFTSAYVNLGKTKNTGTELAIEYIPILRKNKKWQLNFNLTQVKNKLLSIDGSSNYTLTGAYRPLNANTALVVGKPITQIMAYDYQRDDAGNVIIGSDGIPKRGDFIPMGSTIPSLYGGLNNSFTLKQFNISFLIDFRFGNKILSATEDYSYVNGLNQATIPGRESGIIANGVYENGNRNTTVVAAYNYYPELASNISALSVLNGSFIKLRQATLGYAFKESFLKKTPFRNISIDLVGRNLFTLLKYTKNIDPESEFSPVLAYAGIEGASLPATRTFGLNVNLKFK